MTRAIAAALLMIRSTVVFQITVCQAGLTTLTLRAIAAAYGKMRCMRCLALTARFQRCKRANVRFVCRQHRIPFVVGVIGVIATTAAFIGLSRDLVEPWQLRNAVTATTPPARVLSTTVAPVVTQSMVNSPGAIQAAGDVTIMRTRDIVHSLVLDIAFTETTAPIKPSEPWWNDGYQLLGALVLDDGTRIRISTDWTHSDHQVTPTSRKLSFRYTPDPASDLAGRTVDDLSKVDKVLLALAEAFETMHFGDTDGPIDVEMVMTINGVEVGHDTRRFDGRRQLLSSKTSALTIRQMSLLIPRNYRSKVGV